MKIIKVNKRGVIAIMLAGYVVINTGVFVGKKIINGAHEIFVNAIEAEEQYQKAIVDETRIPYVENLKQEKAREEHERQQRLEGEEQRKMIEEARQTYEEEQQKKQEEFMNSNPYKTR